MRTFAALVSVNEDAAAEAIRNVAVYYCVALHGGEDILTI